MAKCPACDEAVRTPSFLNLAGWSTLKCGGCGARLEMIPPRSFLFAPLMPALFVAARQGRVFEVIAFGYMFAIIFFALWESFHPKVRLRNKPLPKPSIRLDIDRPSK